MPAATRASPLVAREREIAVLQVFLGPESPSRALVLSGSSGIGKTALWEAGIELARERGMRILAARAGESELQLSFVVLSDLLADVESRELTRIPAPQLRALDVALLRADPDEAPPPALAIPMGFSSALRTLAADRPLLVAVDDVPWVDPPSAGVLSFAARRLRAQPVRFLLARRPGERTDVERALEAVGLEQVEIEGLSLGATRSLLSERLGLTLPRRILARLVETAQGNPLFALEVGRMLVGRPLPETGEELPIPDLVDDVVRARVAALPDELRRAVLAVALNPGLTRDELVRVAGANPAEDAVAAGLAVLDGERVRPSHPLLAAEVRRQASGGERRSLHRALAEAVGDEVLRARHVALAAAEPDAEIAEAAVRAAAVSIGRGAPADAVELAQHALRLTPPGAPERNERLLELGQYLVVAGEPQRLRELLEPLLAELPPGSQRARAHLILSEAADIASTERHLDEALREGAADPELRASALARKAYLLVARAERIAEANRLADEALAASASEEVEGTVLHALGWARVLAGRGVEDLQRRSPSGSRESGISHSSIQRPALARLTYRGEIDEAERLLARLQALAEEHGEARSMAVLHLHACVLALRAGDLAVAAELLDDAEEWEALEEWQWDRSYARCRAVFEAMRGAPKEAEEWAARTIAAAGASGVRWNILEALRARGIAALLSRRPERAVESLQEVWEQTVREGIDEPGAFAVSPDLVEALAELGREEEGRAVTDRLGRLARQQQHPWALATWKRCRGSFAEAAAEYGALGLHFDRARTLLAHGRAERRAKHWAAARRALEDAADAFEGIGAPGWAAEARSELARVPGRRPAKAGELTPTERRVAELAAEGLANKEIAQALFVTVHTVEDHLSHVYAKLGIRSRTQLAQRL